VIDHLRSRTLFQSPLVTVYDLDCSAPQGDCAGEEYSSRHSLVFPRSGVFVKQTSKKNQLVAECTRVLLFNRNEPYRISHPVAGGDHCTSIHFDDAALVEFIRCIDRSVDDSTDRPFRFSAANCSPSLALNLHRLRRLLLTERSVEPLVVEERCASLLAQSLTSADRQRETAHRPIRASTRQAHREVVDATRVLLARRFREKLSLGEIARAVFSSPFHLARIFRRETGVSLHRQLTRVRLRRALEHLVNGSADLTMLALDLGFSSHAHFSHAFRREFGCAASQFRASDKTFAVRFRSR
jgi:AraC family transcriptional regulator